MQVFRYSGVQVFRRRILAVGELSALARHCWRILVGRLRPPTPQFWGTRCWWRCVGCKVLDANSPAVSYQEGIHGGYGSHRRGKRARISRRRVWNSGSSVTFGCQAIPPLTVHFKNGRLRALALTSAQRSQVLPDVPTMAEAGYAMDISSWLGIAAPAGLPADKNRGISAAL